MSSTDWVVDAIVTIIKLIELRDTMGSFVLYQVFHLWYGVIEFYVSRLRVLYMYSSWKILRIGQWLPWMLPGSTGQFYQGQFRL